MKKTLLILLALSLCLPVYGATVSGRPCPGGAAACTPSTPGNDNSELGYMTEGGTSTAVSNEVIYCQMFSADCSGTLGTAYIYTIANVGSGTSKIGVFSTSDSNDANPPTNGTLVGYTGVINSDDSAGWDSGAMSGGSVTSSAKYWLCLFTNSNIGYRIKRYYDAGLTRHAKTVSGVYATIPATLPTASTCTASETPYSCCTGEGTGCEWATTANQKTSIFVGIQ